MASFPGTGGPALCSRDPMFFNILQTKTKQINRLFLSQLKRSVFSTLSSFPQSEPGVGWSWVFWVPAKKDLSWGVFSVGWWAMSVPPPMTAKLLRAAPLRGQLPGTLVLPAHPALCLRESEVGLQI